MARSVVECICVILGIKGLTGGTICGVSLSCLVMVQLSKTGKCPDMSEKMVTGT